MLDSRKNTCFCTTSLVGTTQTSHYLNQVCPHHLVSLVHVLSLLVFNKLRLLEQNPFMVTAMQTNLMSYPL